MVNNKEKARDIENDSQVQTEKITGQIKAGSYLRLLRTERELSLTSLGEQIGVSAAYLSNVEQGVKSMSDHFIRQIADFYMIDENNIFNLVGRTPLLAREELEEAEALQELLTQIKRDKRLTDDKKEKLYNQMYELYKNFPE